MSHLPPLDSRSRVLLKTLIERYIVDGQPVGSRALSRSSGLELSPATVRNVMSDLEEMGYISSPHTSAGRIPTARGYRFFVDTLLTVLPVESVQVQELKGQLQPDQPQRPGCKAPTGTVVAHLPEPRPGTVNQQPEPKRQA